MNLRGRIMVVTDAVADAELVVSVLGEEFGRIAISTDPAQHVADFEQHRPEVLILAFNTLEASERYYLGLYRLSTSIHTHPHRTVILCGKQDLRRVYQLCRKGQFDDYVLFWAVTHDVTRLAMAVHHALRELAEARDDAPSAAEFAAQARRLAELELLLAGHAAQGSRRAERVSQSLRQAEIDIAAAMDGFASHLSAQGHSGFQPALTRLKTEAVDQHLQAVAVAVRPVREWGEDVEGDFAAQLESLRALQSLAERVRPVILVVDDDEFQHRLLGRMLLDAKLEPLFASSATEAFAVLGRRRPDLILMDVGLPDIDGLETTRRLKSIPRFAAIPVVMITGKGERDVVVESLKAGASDFVVKPADRAVLLARLHRFLYEDPQ